MEEPVTKRLIKETLTAEITPTLAKLLADHSIDTVAKLVVVGLLVHGYAGNIASFPAAMTQVFGGTTAAERQTVLDAMTEQSLRQAPQRGKRVVLTPTKALQQVANEILAERASEAEQEVVPAADPVNNGGVAKGTVNGGMVEVLAEIGRQRALEDEAAGLAARVAAQSSSPVVMHLVAQMLNRALLVS
jgi:hypothetical protein